jgi:hypothetical protein
MVGWLFREGDRVMGLGGQSVLRPPRDVGREQTGDDRGRECIPKA